MGRKLNWHTMNKAGKDLRKRIKDVGLASDYLKDRPEAGFIKDNISKKIVEITSAKSSTLRRYTKLLDKYYYLITSEKDRTWLLNKKIEVETELNTRDDALI